MDSCGSLWLLPLWGALLDMCKLWGPLGAMNVALFRFMPDPRAHKHPLGYSDLWYFFLLHGKNRRKPNISQISDVFCKVHPYFKSTLWEIQTTLLQWKRQWQFSLPCKYFRMNWRVFGRARLRFFDAAFTWVGSLKQMVECTANHPWLRPLASNETVCVIALLVVGTILTSTCASRHRDVRCFNISTSNCVPEVKGFVHCDCDMCFAPWRRVFLEHLDLQTHSGAEVFCAFWFRHVQFLNMSTSKSRPSAGKVANQFRAATACFISHIGKIWWFATFQFFRARASFLFYVFLLSDFFLRSLFPTSAFPSVHIVSK